MLSSCPWGGAILHHLLNLLRQQRQSLELVLGGRDEAAVCSKNVGLLNLNHKQGRRVHLPEESAGRVLSASRPFALQLFHDGHDLRNVCLSHMNE
jgi:hypothetical protein